MTIDALRTDSDQSVGFEHGSDGPVADDTDLQPRRRLPHAPKNGLAASLEHRRIQCHILTLLVDVAILLGTFAIITLVLFDFSPNQNQLNSGLLPVYMILPVFQTIALYNGSYSRATLTDAISASWRVTAALLVSAALVSFIAFFAKVSADASRSIVTLGLFCSAVAMVLFRVGFARWLTSRWGPNPINQLVIHAGGPKITLPNAYHVDAEEHGLDPDADDPRALDRLAKYFRNMDEVTVSCADAKRLAWSEVLKGSGKHGEVVDSAAREMGALGVMHHDKANVSSLKVSAGHLGLRARVLKRLFDVSAAATALLALSPLFMVIALLIKLHDGGPVFFMQRRVGRGNAFFDIYKFRSMRAADADGNRSASKTDDRITPIGRFIRRTSIDELPQLINVLLGDMSLVGPRPHALGSKAGTKLFWHLDRKYWQRHGLRPGITGLAQVRGFRGATDHESDLEKRLSADLEYLNGWSIWRDIRILFAPLTDLVTRNARGDYAVVSSPRAVPSRKNA